MSGPEINAAPLYKKKKIELRQGGTHRQKMSRGCDSLQRGKFLRRAGEWPILGTSPASAPSEDDEKGGREVQRWLNAWRLWEFSVFPLTILIMDVPGISRAIHSKVRDMTSFKIHFSWSSITFLKQKGALPNGQSSLLFKEGDRFQYNQIN